MAVGNLRLAMMTIHATSLAAAKTKAMTMIIPAADMTMTKIFYHA